MIILTAWSLRNSEEARIHTRSFKIYRGHKQLHAVYIGKHACTVALFTQRHTYTQAHVCGYMNCAFWQRTARIYVDATAHACRHACAEASAFRAVQMQTCNHHAYIHIHVLTHPYTHTYMHTYMQHCMHADIWICIDT